jgi:hypothetical protein
MKKILYLIFTFALGFLFAEMVRRPKMKRLKEFEEIEARRDARYARDEQVWQAELAAKPFEQRMDWELFEASLKQANYKPDWDENDGEVDDAVET